MMTVVYVVVSFLAGLVVGAIAMSYRPMKSVHALDRVSSWFRVED